MTMGRSIALFLMLLGSLALGLAGIAQQSATEAPAGFDTPTLAQNAGSRSISNGIEEPPGDTFALDQQIYEQTHDVNSGLGPVFNARACAECHQNPVSGGASQFTELRAGHLDAAGTFANPTVLIDDGADSISGRSIINDRAVIPQAQEHVPVTEDIRALRAALNTLGDGFVEAIDDSTLLAIAEHEVDVSEGRIHGEAICRNVGELARRASSKKRSMSGQILRRTQRGVNRRCGDLPVHGAQQHAGIDADHGHR